ncbi:MAG TPA: hypothetical protein VF506_14925 [Streptosporangiaceae bacterium]
MSGKHLEGRRGWKHGALCGAKIRDPLTEVTYPERDGIHVPLCPDCAAQIPSHPVRRALSGLLRNR